ncbi:MAG: hypothetical protein Kow00121_45860 [Elainellaceae cyanobacterium]
MLHFQEPGRNNPVSPDAKIPDPAYGMALDHLVIACVDVIFTHQSQVLLVKRNRYPHPSWWIVGGRMVAGEEPKQTAIRKAAAEIGIQTLEAASLRYVGTYSTCFAFRQQVPQDHGSHTLNITFHAELTSSERKQMRLYPNEHTTWQWVKLNQLEQILDRSQVMDQALLRIMQDLQTLQVIPI